jgi:hypothetical protein
MEINLNTEAITKFEFDYSIAANEDGTYSLRWNDLVINDWEETFPTLSITLARLAALVACGESDWNRCFASSAEDFVDSAANFLAAEAS